MEKHVRFSMMDQKLVRLKMCANGNLGNISIETVDKMTDRQISAKVRKHFLT